MEDIKKKLNEAYSLAEKKDYAKALEMCNAVIAAHPSEFDGLRERAAIYSHMNDLNRAIADISTVITQGSHEPMDYFKRGWLHLDNDNPVQAAEDLSKALEIGEENDFHYYDESAYFFRSLAFLRLQRWDEALADCEHVRDDFLIYIKSAGKITKADVVQQAMASKKKK